MTISGNYDITNADTEELKKSLNKLLRWLKLPEVQNNSEKKAQYEQDIKTIQTELSKRENKNMASIAKPTDGMSATSSDDSLKRISQANSAMQSSYNMLKRDRNNAYPAARNRDEYVKKFGKDDPMLKFNDSMANMSDEEIEQRKREWQDMADQAAAELERRGKLKVIKGHRSLNPNIINGIQNNGVN